MMIKLTPEQIEAAFVQAKKEKASYGEIYPLLEPLFVHQARIKEQLNLPRMELDPQLVATKWEEGFPLVMRWDFPFDPDAAQQLLSIAGENIPRQNDTLLKARQALQQAIDDHPDERSDLWASFMHHEWEPWDQWVKLEGVDSASLLFLARSCLRPAIEWGAEDLLDRFALPQGWLKGYCPVCGSLPGFLHLEGKGERQAHCSWCGTQWGLYRLQCPYCDNRVHDSLGYLYAEEEPLYRVQYCNLCKMYFKLIDLRERLDPAFIPLEEWTTIHLDLLARREGWQTPPSPHPFVYEDTEARTGGVTGRESKDMRE